jgi:xanthine dehydrogenase iron-sulfur cluster and FAD-binding subunit A
MWRQYINAGRIEDALDILTAHKGVARIIAGGTDLLLEIKKEKRPDLDILVDISRINGLDSITLDSFGQVHIGATVTHNQCASSQIIQKYGLPLAQASWQVGSSQIRNMATVAGNVVTASPANDTISPLMALNARLVLQSKTSTRTVNLRDFFQRVRRTIIQPDEILVEIIFQGMSNTQRGIFTKHGLRKAQAISLVNTTIILDFDDQIIRDAVITLGAVAPTIVTADLAQNFLIGKQMSNEVIEQTAELAVSAANPIDDIRSQAKYRNHMIRVMTCRGLLHLRDSRAKSNIPKDPVRLWGKNYKQRKYISFTTSHSNTETIQIVINNKEYLVRSGNRSNLLELIREEAGLTGTKEGCGEGECGACTIYLDGIAINACMVAAPRAHLTNITTIEGIESKDELHPIQKALINEGAVQCGYCIPGFVMSAVKLLEEKSTPTVDEIKQAFAGNLCRCTGYYKIIRAVEGYFQY